MLWASKLEAKNYLHRSTFKSVYQHYWVGEGTKDIYTLWSVKVKTKNVQQRQVGQRLNSWNTWPKISKSMIGKRECKIYKLLPHVSP